MIDKILHKKNIEFLIVHCSDTPNDDEFTAREIHLMHLSFNWDGIGYHKVINRDGSIENGRPEYWIGAHTKGLNQKSLGVCLIGRDKFTDLQMMSLEKVLRKWKEKYPKSKILGHCDAIATSKTCPNFNVISWCKQINL
tara:strand:- start:30 stop:446 length:417 start_codon:yes stop_codon:yes gene_type:complete